MHRLDSMATFISLFHVTSISVGRLKKDANLMISLFMFGFFFFSWFCCVPLPPSLPSTQNCAFCSTYFLAVPQVKQSSYTQQLPEVCCSGADFPVFTPNLLLQLQAIAVRCLPTLLFQMLLFHHPVSHSFHRGSPTTLLLTTIWSCTKAKAPKIPHALAPQTLLDSYYLLEMRAEILIIHTY